MGTTTAERRLTPGRRIARGLKYSVLGPAELARGTLGVGVNAVKSTTGWTAARYAARGAKAGVRTVRRRPPKAVLIGGGVAAVALGAFTFTVVRRSTRPEPSPLPPSVDVTAQP